MDRLPHYFWGGRVLLSHSLSGTGRARAGTAEHGRWAQDSGPRQESQLPPLPASTSESSQPFYVVGPTESHLAQLVPVPVFLPPVVRLEVTGGTRSGSKSRTGLWLWHCSKLGLLLLHAAMLGWHWSVLPSAELSRLPPHWTLVPFLSEISGSGNSCTSSIFLHWTPGFIQPNSHIIQIRLLPPWTWFVWWGCKFLYVIMHPLVGSS